MLPDMPPGCGDIPPNLCTTFPADGTIAATDPGSLSVEAVQRCINLCVMLMSAEAYVLPHGCVIVSGPLSGEIAA